LAASFDCNRYRQIKSQMNFLKKLFGIKTKAREFTTDEYERHGEEKQLGLEWLLGKMHHMVGHAIIPFDVGGAVDMYYFPKGPVSGTAFATQELIKPDGSGSIPNIMGTYELVTFTKKPMTDDDSEEHPFNKMERRMCGIMTGIGNYSFQAKLEPGETAELPSGEGEENKCLIFDEYRHEGQHFMIGNRRHGLLLIMEVFRSEMQFARDHGSDQLFNKLKEKGIYPYSDLDRNPVV
jgi:hypothetical protein